MPRRVVRVCGVVQGVGFRPYIYGLARRLGLHGCVRNQSGAVLVEIEGSSSALDTFLAQLVEDPPPLARIDQVTCTSESDQGALGFSIENSELTTADVIFISPDIATCSQCLSELFERGNRRFHYAFANCACCGPRLTIITAAPYDRQRTSMNSFEMCAACRHEYEDSFDRRFHAQPIACPNCGPHLIALDASGQRIATANPVQYAAAELLRGKIGALKGVGGYHLSCDARQQNVVVELRRRKHRDAKPFALMVRNVAAAQRICEVSPAQQEILQSPARPIVLLRRHAQTEVCREVAPGSQNLGVFLPYSPFHHLLLEAVGDTPLVMTSGNQCDEPIAYDDQDALQRLGSLADFFIIHNRPIHIRCDDSVTRVVAGAELPLRRSRGYAPSPLKLPRACLQPTLAVGSQQKSTFALGRHAHAFLSHHLGDLDNYEAYRSYVKAIQHYEQLFDIKPEWIIHDLHPEYASTRYAAERTNDGAPPKRLAVQHHHAHLASCLAENGLNEPAIGVIFDGTGLGTDEAIWGGEFLVGDLRCFRRAAHLRYVALPGGDRAIVEPWRMAVSYLLDAAVDVQDFGLVATDQQIAVVQQMIARRFNTPLTSSMGRLFDAVASLAGVRHRVNYDAQAAMELECLATQAAVGGIYPVEFLEPGDSQSASSPLQIDTRPMITAVAADVRCGTSCSLIARRFHSTLVEMVVNVCKRLRDDTTINSVALSGGVFANALLLSELVPRLSSEGFRVIRHRLVPPNDGGLSLGQLAIAAAVQNGDNLTETN